MLRGSLCCSARTIDLTTLKETRDELYDYDEFLHRGGIVPLGQGHLDLTQVLLPMMSKLMDGGWLVVDPQGAGASAGRERRNEPRVPTRALLSYDGTGRDQDRLTE